MEEREEEKVHHSLFIMLQWERSPTKSDILALKQVSRILRHCWDVL